MTPFAPVSPDGHRSFPSKHLSKGVGEWNHYYVRCINGEVRLWVNGEEVSGGTGCEPARVMCAWNPREHRWNSDSCGFASCRERRRSGGELDYVHFSRKPVSHSINRSRITTSSTISPSSSIKS